MKFYKGHKSTHVWVVVSEVDEDYVMAFEAKHYTSCVFYMSWYHHIAVFLGFYYVRILGVKEYVMISKRMLNEQYFESKTHVDYLEIDPVSKMQQWQKQWIKNMKKEYWDGFIGPTEGIWSRSITD